MKKVLSLILALAFLFLLVACGSPAGSESSPGGNSVQPGSSDKGGSAGEMVTLRFWGGVPPEYGPQAVVDAFNAEYADKGIQAEYTRYVNDDTGNMKLETTLLGGGEIDLYVTYNMHYLVKRGEGSLALELSDKLSEKGFDMVEEMGEATSSFIYDGNIYGVPTKMENYYFLANVDMFEEAGVPLPLDGWTYSEFRETCKKLTKGEGMDKQYGMFWNTGYEIFRPGYMAQAVLGDNLLYKEGGKETNLDNEQLIMANQLVADTMLVDKTAISHTDQVTQQVSIESAFLGEKAAMSVGVWAIRSIKNLQDFPHDFETAYLPAPTPDTGDVQYSIGEGVIGDFVCINPNSEHIDEALEFLTWYARGGIMSMCEYGRVPLCVDIPLDEKLNTYMKNSEGILHRASMEKYLENQPNMAIPTETNHIAEIQNVYSIALEEIFTGKKDTETALKEAKIKADSFLK